MGIETGSDWLRLLVGLVAVMAFASVNALFLVWLERKVPATFSAGPARWKWDLTEFCRRSRTL